MREYTKNPGNQSRTLDSDPRASRQAPISEILQARKNGTLGRQPVQGESIEDEGLLQGPTLRQTSASVIFQRCKESIQRYTQEESEELLNGKFDTTQSEGIDEDVLLQGKFESTPTTEQELKQLEEKPNNIGLPDNLKTDIESFSGYSMGNVRVHYNSDKPDQLKALAYARGTDISVAPQQEKNQLHEAWHVVQQKQGHVQPTLQWQGVNVKKNFQLGPLVIQRLPKFSNEEEAIIYFEDTMLEDMENHLYDLDLLIKIATKSGWEDLMERITYYSSKNKTLIALQIKKLDLTNFDNFEVVKKILDIVQENKWDDLEDEILPAFRKLEDSDDYIEYSKEKSRKIILNAGYYLFQAATTEDFSKALKITREMQRLLLSLKTDELSMCLPSKIKIQQTKGDLMKALGDFKRPFGDLIIPHIFASDEQLCMYISNYIKKKEDCPEGLKNIEGSDYTKEVDSKKVAEEIVKKAKSWLSEQFKSPKGIQNLVNLTYSQIQELTVCRDKSSQEALSKRMEGEKFNEILSKLKSKEKLKEKATTIKHLFDDNPHLSAEALKIRKGEIHPTLKHILDGQQHSIIDIDGYVGDKLEDPLMSWIIRRKIPVEVHATSLLASFAKLNSEGFTDIIKIPSSHEGTSKYIAYNPQNKCSKIVFQTMPGKSYQIQTTGAFLFYELYDFDNQLCHTVENPEDGPYKYEQYKAIKILKEEKEETIKRALYLLIDEHAGKKLLAEVPFIDVPFEIKDGAIMLQGIDKDCIKIREIERLNPEQLTIFEEEINYKKMYLSALTGLTKIDIAVLGGSGELERKLSEKKVKPFRQISLLQFNAKLYEMQDKGKQEVILFSCQISPHFFGDRAGKLVEALKELNVEHLIFTGTAGGLDSELKLGDIVIPDSVESYSEGTFAGKKKENKGKDIAYAMVEDPKITGEKLKIGGFHVGVHSPLMESKAMVEKLQIEKISSIDCEGGFIADALTESDVSLYQYLYISDVPGTEDSIGEGGMAVKKTSEHPKVEDSEKQGAATIDLILKTIEVIIGCEISNAQKEAEKVAFPIKDNVIKAKNGIIRINVLLPEVSKGDGKTTGVLKLFAESISEILEETEGQIDFIFQKEIITLIQNFYTAHQIMISVGFELSK